MLSSQLPQQSQKGLLRKILVIIQVLTFPKERNLNLETDIEMIIFPLVGTERLIESGIHQIIAINSFVNTAPP